MIFALVLLSLLTITVSRSSIELQMSSIGFSSILSSIWSIFVSSWCITSNLFSSSIFDSCMGQLLNIVENWVTFELLILRFWEICDVDGEVLSNSDIMKGLFVWRYSHDEVSVIGIVEKYYLIDIPILTIDFNWFDDRFESK